MGKHCGGPPLGGKILSRRAPNILIHYEFHPADFRTRLTVEEKSCRNVLRGGEWGAGGADDGQVVLRPEQR